MTLDVGFELNEDGSRWIIHWDFREVHILDSTGLRIHYIELKSGINPKP